MFCYLILQTPSLSCSPEPVLWKARFTVSTQAVDFCILSLGTDHDLSITYLGKGSPLASFLAGQWHEGQEIIHVVAHKFF